MSVNAGRPSVKHVLPARLVKHAVAVKAAAAAHKLHRNHACEFQLWGWESHGLPPVNLGRQTLQIMDMLTMDLSKFVRIEFVRMTGIEPEYGSEA